MYCVSCGHKNTKKSNFCKECGSSLKAESANPSGVSKIKIEQIKEIIKKHDKKVIAGVGALILISSLTAYAAPKAIDYFEVSDLVEEAKNLSEKGEFNQAASVLAKTEGLWTFQDNREDIESLEEEQKRNAQDKKRVEKGLELKEGGDLESLKEARALFNKVNASYPDYQGVKDHLASTQKSIEEKLQQQLAEEEAEAEAARARAARERAAKAEAQQKAEEAAAEKAASEAKARAAQKEKERAEDQAAEEKAQAFIDETVTIYNSLIDAEDSLAAALNDYTNLNFSSYNFSRAYALLDDIKTRSQNMLQYRTPEDWEAVPNTLYSAAQNLDNATYYLAESMIAFGKGSSSWETYYDKFQNYYYKADDDLAWISAFLEEMGR